MLSMVILRLTRCKRRTESNELFQKVMEVTSEHDNKAKYILYFSIVLSTPARKLGIYFSHEAVELF